MQTLIIGFASNFATQQAFQSAWSALRNIFPRLRVSTPEITAPLQQSGPDYLNALFLCETNLPLSAVQRSVKLIEANAGRIKLQKNIPVDLDVLAYGNDLLRSELLERDFNRRALQDLLPDYTYAFRDR